MTNLETCGEYATTIMFKNDEKILTQTNNNKKQMIQVRNALEQIADKMSKDNWEPRCNYGYQIEVVAYPEFIQVIQIE